MDSRETRLSVVIGVAVLAALFASSCAVPNDSREEHQVSAVNSLSVLSDIQSKKAYPTDLPSKCTRDKLRVSLDDSYDHTRFAPEKADMLVRFAAYTSSFDTDDDDNGDGILDYRATPEWVSYELKRYPHKYKEKFLAPPKLERPPEWYEDDAYDFLYMGREDGLEISGTGRKIHKSYAGDREIRFPESGATIVVERGHLTPKLHGDRVSWEAGCNTHYFFNAVPQNDKMNGGVWLRLEAYSGALANKFGRVWVIAGPVYDKGIDPPTLGTTGEIPVAVPHALFKVLIWEDLDGKLQAKGFIFRQDKKYVRSCGWNTQKKLPQYIVPISKIEKLTGLKFFRKNVGSSDRRRLLRQSRKTLLAIKKQYHGCYCGKCNRPGTGKIPKGLS